MQCPSCFANCHSHDNLIIDSHPDQDSNIKNMCKTYTLEDNDGLMAELKSMHGKMAEMRGRLERDEITPDEWREWYAGYQARLDEIKEAVSGMREEVSRRNADLERQKRERTAELNMSLEDYEKIVKLADKIFHLDKKIK